MANFMHCDFKRRAIAAGIDGILAAAAALFACIDWDKHHFGVNIGAG